MSVYSRYLHFPTFPKKMQTDRTLLDSDEKGRKHDRDLRRKMFRKAKRAEHRNALDLELDQING